jgi:acetoin utilization deacetylase AcuC-like enzyme
VPNGFGTYEPEIVEQVLAANSAMIKGVKVALEHGNCLVPASGFHHASYDSSWGFCTFNGMILAAVVSGKKTLIIDGDAHYGDGCVNIIKKCGLQDQITYVQSFDGHDDLTCVKDYELVIYQPGADSLEEGPTLTQAQFRFRDLNVFDTCIGFKIPILWCLGGGYNSLFEVTRAHRWSVGMLAVLLGLERLVAGGSPPQAEDTVTQVQSTNP